MNTSTPPVSLPSTRYAQPALRYKSGKTDVHYFDSLHDFLPHVTEEKVRAAKGNDDWRQELGKYTSSTKSDMQWAGGLTAKQAYALAKEGMTLTPMDLEIREKINTECKPMIDDSFAWDVTGQMVDVGAFLAGEPECMLTTREDNTRARKTVTIMFNAAVSCDVSPQILKLRGLAMLAFVDALEATKKYRVSLYYCCASGMNYGSDQANGALVIKLLDPSYRYDPQAIGYALSNPTMFRRLCFAYWNCLDPQTARAWGIDNWGYGTPATLRKLPKEVEPEDATFGATECLHTGVQQLPFYNEAGAVQWIKSQMERLTKDSML
jgi:hypothetical protein